MRKVYENIDLIRIAKGVTKRHLAKRIGISEMACNRILWGESKLPAEMVKNFADSLEVTDINIFFDDTLTDSVIENLQNTIAI